MKFLLTSFAFLFLVGSPAWAKKVKVKWASIPHAQFYDVELVNASGRKHISKAAATKTPQVEWTYETTAGLWAFRIRAVDRVGRPGLWSAWRALPVFDAPPRLLTPKQDETLEGLNAAETVFEWEKSTGAGQYRFVLEHEGKTIKEAVLRGTQARLKFPQSGDFRWQVSPVLLGSKTWPVEQKEFEGPPSNWGEFSVQVTEPQLKEKDLDNLAPGNWLVGQHRLRGRTWFAPYSYSGDPYGSVTLTPVVNYLMFAGEFRYEWWWSEVWNAHASVALGLLTLTHTQIYRQVTLGVEREIKLSEEPSYFFVKPQAALRLRSEYFLSVSSASTFRWSSVDVVGLRPGIEIGMQPWTRWRLSLSAEGFFPLGTLFSETVSLKSAKGWLENLQLSFQVKYLFHRKLEFSGALQGELQGNHFLNASNTTILRDYSWSSLNVIFGVSYAF